jgi:hypothetical protein
VNVAHGKHNPPSCAHGEWTFAESDTKRGASKWRCPSRTCQLASVWIKADRLHTLIPRTTDRWKALYRTRGSVERWSADSSTSGACCPCRSVASPESGCT